MPLVKSAGKAGNERETDCDFWRASLTACARQPGGIPVLTALFSVPALSLMVNCAILTGGSHEPE